MKKVTLEFANDTSNLKKYKEELYARIVKSQYYNEFRIYRKFPINKIQKPK